MPCKATMTTSFIQAAIHVLSTMAGITPVSGEIQKERGMGTRGDISAIIGITGPRNGSVCVSFSRQSAESIVRAMFGDDIEDIEQDIKDAVGEIANIISGHARNDLAAAGMAFQGSTPTLVVGAGHVVSHMSQTEVTVIPFHTGTGAFVISYGFEN